MGALRRGQLRVHHALLLAHPYLVQKPRHRHCAGTDQLASGHGVLFHRRGGRHRYRGAFRADLRRARRPQR